MNKKKIARKKPATKAPPKPAAEAPKPAETEDTLDRIMRERSEREALEAPVLRLAKWSDSDRLYSEHHSTVGELLAVSFGGLHAGHCTLAVDALNNVAGELDVLRMALKSGNIGEDGNISEEDFDTWLYTLANRCRAAAELDGRIDAANKAGVSS
jgi:hypothetical protein